MKFKFLITILIIIPLLGFAQDKKSKADNLPSGYRSQQAIAEYKKEMEKKPLTNHQLLNLADSYFSTGKYDNASELSDIIDVDGFLIGGASLDVNKFYSIYNQL